MPTETIEPIDSELADVINKATVDRRLAARPPFITFRKEEVEQSIVSRFEYIVANHPKNIAIKDNERTITYSELNTMANGVAQAILRRPQTGAAPVALIFEKGAPLIASMLGVLKSGMFFVLLNPSFPRPRLSAILADLGAKSVIFDNQNGLLAQDLVAGECQLIAYDPSDLSVSVENPRITITPDAIAAVVYTSGSTGAPKGVIQTHRSILHDMMLRTNAYSVCQDDRMSLLSSGTSSAINNTFLALLNGATLLSFNTHKEGAAGLATWLSKERISICWISSPLFRRFAATLTGNELFPDLRLIRLASDTVHNSDIDLYKKHFPSTAVLANGIAPTETGLLTTYFIDHQTEIVGNEVPLGYALEDKEILLLNDAGNTVGFDELGEIAVRSDYLTPGYWNNPRLTQMRYIFDATCSERPLYLTGDLGLMRPDGCLIYKGRKDFRVKIRGYGVEISEVEAAVAAYQGVRETVVLGRENELGETYLVAYLTTPMGVSPKTGELRAFLSKSLPDYMIPSIFVKLDTLPLTPNGKVDRRALPEPDSSARAVSPFEEARTPIEEQLTKIWMQAFGRDRIAINDNFFDLGGDSLTAIQILAQLRSTFDIEVPLSTFFDKAMIVELAPIVALAKQHNA